MKARDLFTPFLISIILSFVIVSCSKDESGPASPDIQDDNKRGDILQVDQNGSFTIEEIKLIMEDYNVSLPFQLKHAVRVYGISYYTLINDNDLVLASGALLIPDVNDQLPVMKILHGTETKRDRVASVSVNNSVEGIIGLITSSLGYFTIIPDYPGFGISDADHPYMHASSLVPSIVDFIKAGKNFASAEQINLSSKLYLTGYSEGGYLCLAAQKIIEEDQSLDIQLEAVAPMSGPYDLRGTIDTIFRESSYISTAYSAYFLKAYNEIYAWNRLKDFFYPPYGDQIPTLFNGTKTWSEVQQELPLKFTDLMDQEFINGYNNGNEVEIMDALDENTFLDWTPETRIHFFHGDNDQTVPYHNVLTAIERLSANGDPDIQLTTIEGGNHQTTGPVSSIAAIQWFEAIRDKH